MSKDPRLERDLREAKAFLVLVVAFMLLLTVSQSLGWHVAVQPFEEFSAVARAMFTEFIVPFEILGFLLLAALIGSLYIAHKEVRRRV